jgi:hypothetical protein
MSRSSTGGSSMSSTASARPGDPEGNRWSFGTYRGEPRKG